MRLITIDDIIDVYLKSTQRGFKFITSKFNLSGVERTKSAFDETAVSSSNWWVIPEVKRRWNFKITGNADLCYEAYLMDKYFENSSNIRMLSIGSGVCSHELFFAQYPQFEKITCIDLVDTLLQKAREQAKKSGLKNIEFITADALQYDFGSAKYDIILFHSSLHHFLDIENLIKNKVLPLLKTKGKLIVNEYVGANRFQYPEEQIRAINTCLNGIAPPYKKRYKSNWVKNKYRGSGLIRMVIADPSECKESARIKPLLKEYFNVIEEKPYGGNLLMGALKDIAHHFVKPGEKKKAILNRLFQEEDEYLESHESDFLFGFYEQKKIV